MDGSLEMALATAAPSNKRDVEEFMPTGGCAVHWKSAVIDAERNCGSA
jgi:hypothetical protein